jgi:hypothetical protein
VRWLLLLACVTTVHADPYARDTRVTHLGRALSALRALGADGRQQLDHDLHAGVRARCPSATPAASCMAEVGRAVCATRRGDCAAAADVVLANEHAASDLVDEATRMRLVRTSSDYHAAINAELWTRYALLAAELALFEGGGDDAARIDRFCVERDRQVHRCEPGTAKTCVPNLAWQRCAAALVWFVAGHQGGAR